MLEDDCDWNDFVKFRKLNVDNAKLREQNAKLLEYVEWLEDWVLSGFLTRDIEFQIEMKRRELGIEVR